MTTKEMIKKEWHEAKWMLLITVSFLLVVVKIAYVE